TIRNMTGEGILFRPSGSSTFAATNTLVADNDFVGISILPISSSAVDVAVVMNRVQAHNNRDGIYFEANQAKGSLTAVITDTTADGNAMVGFAFNSFNGGMAISAVISRSVAVYNYEGIASTAGNSTVRVGRSLVTGNVYGWFADGTATLLSYADNDIDGNPN